MSILSAVSNEIPRAGIRGVIAAVEKMGKTTLTCNAPRALLIPLEVGYATIKVAKTPFLEYYEHVMQLMDEIIAQCEAKKFPYQTVVVDSVTALERLIHDSVVRMDPGYGKAGEGNKKAVTMESALGGYGKAYTFANERFGDFLKKCDKLSQTYGINILLTCHVFPSEVADPTAGNYNCWDLLLHSPKNQKTYGKREMLTQWADMIGYLHEPVVVTEGKGKNMNMAVTAGKGRVLALTRTPSYVAGNRFKVTDEIAIPEENGWNHVAAAIYNACGIDVYNRDIPQEAAK